MTGQGPEHVTPEPIHGVTRRQALAMGGGLLAGCGLGGLYLGMDSVASASSGGVLRPPGALDERAFLSACIRCGQCVDACPFGTLRLTDLTVGLKKVGAPTFEASETPCYLCQGYDELLCIEACPTQALGPVADPREVRIGLAVIDQDICLAYNGAMCRACWHACPYPDEAIKYNEMLRPFVCAETCTGCGLCEYACPTETKSIVIEADAERVHGGHGRRGSGRGNGRRGRG